MVFGETSEQYLARKKGPTRVFAWLPKEIEDGRKAWLVPLERTGEWVDCYPVIEASGWVYKYRLLP